MKKTEQVVFSGGIVLDFDTKLTFRNIFEVLKEIFCGHTIIRDGRQILLDNKVGFLVSNITYLGNPHPIYKKRIQLKKYYPLVFEKNGEEKIITVFLGIYSYKNLQLFVVFKTLTYINNKFNNSSAHIYTSDLQNALKDGFYLRRDKNNNEIVILSKFNFIIYISNLLNENAGVKKLEYEKTILEYLQGFFKTIPERIEGINAYSKMADSNYANYRQEQWCGFYYEFLFDKYYIENKTSLIKRNVLLDYIDNNGNKVFRNGAKNNPDLDLSFPMIDNFYGDLKSDNIKSGVLGNDYETIKNIVEKGGRVWYIVLSFTPNFDKDYADEVWNYWNKLRAFPKTSAPRNSNFKHDIIVNEITILNIDSNTWRHISEFKQGRNSNGKPRESKVMILKKHIDEMRVFKMDIKH